jgi:hypothetical protein
MAVYGAYVTQLNYRLSTTIPFKTGVGLSFSAKAEKKAKSSQKIRNCFLKK